MSKQWLLVMSVALCFLFLLSACNTGNSTESKDKESGGSKSGGSITFGLAAEPDTLEAYMQNGTHGRTIKFALARGLYNYNEKGELEAELAKDYTVNDDATSYTFNLRDANFHNGDPVTAEDVKYTFERIIAEESTATFKSELSVIDSIEVKDEKTITFNLSQSAAHFVHYTALPESVVISKSWTEEHKNDLSTNFMGAGPFKLVEWAQGSHITVEKFDNYYKEGKPYLDEIKFEFYTDENARVNALRAGNVDMIETVPWKDVASLEKSENVNLDSKNGPFMALQFNTKFEPFSKPKVRKAIAYAIDRKSIIDTAFSGRGQPIYGMAILEGYMGYDEKFTNYFEYNPEKAKELLSEAGYPNGFSATLLATSQYGMYEQTAVAVQSELKKVGIDIELDLPDWSTWVNRNTKADYDFLIAGTSGDIIDGDWMNNYYKGGGSRLNNSAYFDDKKINDLLAKGRQTTDETERQDIYENLISRALDLSPFVYLNWREQSYGMSEDVSGFKNLDGFLSFQSGVTLEETTVEK